MLETDVLSIASLGVAVAVGDFNAGNIDLFCTYDATWQAKYFEIQGLKHDPVVIKGLGVQGFFTWTLDPKSPFGAIAYDYDIRSGVGFASTVSGSRLLAGMPLNQSLTEIEKALLREVFHSHHLDVLTARAIDLTSQQKRLIQMTAQGHRAKTIAYELEISEETVKQRKRRIERQIGVTNFSTVIALATRAGYALHPIN